jgi:hypothetical protein
LLRLFWRWGSRKLFTWAGLEPWSSWSQLPKVARITGVTHQRPARSLFSEWCFASVTGLDIKAVEVTRSDKSLFFFWWYWSCHWCTSLHQSAFCHTNKYPWLSTYKEKFFLVDSFEGSSPWLVGPVALGLCRGKQHIMVEMRGGAKPVYHKSESKEKDEGLGSHNPSRIILLILQECTPNDLPLGPTSQYHHLEC